MNLKNRDNWNGQIKLKVDVFLGEVLMDELLTLLFNSCGVDSTSCLSLIIFLSFWKSGSVALGLFRPRVLPYFFAGKCNRYPKIHQGKKDRAATRGWLTEPVLLLPDCPRR